MIESTVITKSYSMSDTLFMQLCFVPERIQEKYGFQS